MNSLLILIKQGYQPIRTLAHASYIAFYFVMMPLLCLTFINTAFAQETRNIKDIKTIYPLQPPPTMNECENGMCSTWTFEASGKAGTATWQNGTVASLKVERFTEESIIIYRTDTVGSIGLVGTYAGRIDNNKITGTVAWIWPEQWGGQVRTGTWTATFQSLRNITHDPSEDAGKPINLSDPSVYLQSGCISPESAQRLISSIKKIPMRKLPDMDEKSSDTENHVVPAIKPGLVH
ncbi:MAG: hypothetical protein V4525_06385 [Pseudomonadota bacterium]